MNWNVLYDMQEKLDQYIGEQQQINQSEQTEQKILALLVEVGELANETRCFKFWSTKPPSEKHVIEEEYVDGLHFILSLGLDLGFRYEPTPIHTKDSLTDAFLRLFHAINTFKQERSNHAYQSMWVSFLELGRSLELDENEIMDAYYNKNKVNFQRQDQGY